MNAKESPKICDKLKEFFKGKGKKKFGMQDNGKGSDFTYSWQKKGYWKGIKPGKNPNAEHHEGDGG